MSLKIAQFLLAIRFFLHQGVLLVLEGGLVQAAVKIEINEAINLGFQVLQLFPQDLHSGSRRSQFIRLPPIDALQEPIPPFGGQRRILTYLRYLCGEALLPQKPALITNLRLALVGAAIINVLLSTALGVYLGGYRVAALSTRGKTQEQKLSLPVFAGFSVVTERFLYAVKMRL